MRTRRFFSGAVLATALVMAGSVLAQQGPAPGAGAPGGGPPRAQGGPGGGGPGAGGAPRGGGGIVPMTIESKAYPDGGVIPLKYSMYGGSTLPDFKITRIPATAQSMALIFHDLDVAAGGNPDDNLHWMAWNIPLSGDTLVIEEGKIPDGAVGKGMRGAAFMGPGAPNLGRYHHYIFEFYALSSKLDLPATAGRPDLLEAMKGKVVAKAAYAGRFANDTNAGLPGMGGPGAGGPPRAPGAGGPPGAGAPPPGAGH